MPCSVDRPAIHRIQVVQRRATKMITSITNKSYEERSTRLNLFFLEKVRLGDKLIECFKKLKGFTSVDASKLFSRSSRVKLRCKQIQLENIKFFLTNDVVRKWNKLPPSVV